MPQSWGSAKRWGMKVQKEPVFPAPFVRAKGLEPLRREALDPKSSLATNYNTPAFTAPKVWIFDGIAKKCVGDYGDTAAPCPTERGLGER